MSTSTGTSKKDKVNNDKSSRIQFWLSIGVVVFSVSVTAAWKLLRTTPQYKTQVTVVDTSALDDEVCISAPPIPYDPASGLEVSAPRIIPPEARCPVCGMYPARFAEWSAQIIYSDGYVHFFDSPLSLFHHLQDVPRFAVGRDLEDVAHIYVSDSAVNTPKDEQSTKPWLDARQAFYVHGSSARGPMRGGDLPAFASEQAAKEFAQRRGGEVLSFSQIDAPILESLGSMSAHNHD